MTTDLLTSFTSDIVSHLRSNIADPNTARSGNFIYPDMFHRRATMPRITVIVTNVESSGENRDIDGSKYYTIYFDVDVWVGTKIIFTINGSKYVPSKLLDYLTDKVIDVVDETFENNIRVLSLTRNAVIDMDSGLDNILKKKISYVAEVI